MNEITLLSSDVLLQQLSDLTDEVFFAFQPLENKLLYLNAAFEKVWNISRATAGTGLSVINNSIHPDDRIIIANAIVAITTNRRKQHIEFRINTGDGQQKWIQVNAFSFKQNMVDTIIGIATDITGNKAYNDTLHKINNKKNTILEILAHDLASPLKNIQMSVQVLAAHLEDKQDATLTTLLEVLAECSRKSIEMISSFINKDFLEPAEVALLKQRTDIVEKIREIVSQYQQSSYTKRPRFHFIATTKSLFVKIDESKFMQVINNLLSNALKFTHNDGEITIEVKDEGRKVLIKVEDNGIGIPAAMHPFLFDKYTSAKRPGLNGEESTGLGMSIIKTIVEWHNGQVWFKSEEGKGTAFYVEIPKDS